MERYQHQVQYYETDRMGIVHHSNYIRWMEEARMDFFRKIGCGYEELEREGIISPVTSVDCKYKMTTTFGDIIDIAVRAEAFNGVKLKLRYEMYNGEDLVCEGCSEHCFLDANRKLISLKKCHQKVYELLVNAELNIKK